MKNILMIATGGTIASKRTSGGLVPLMTSEELIRFVPEVNEFCNIDTIQLFCVDSTNIKPSHWTSITQTIEKAYERYDGFVITHGTDTMAYTSAALSYLIQNSIKPIVITGAQKPIDMENTDARQNLHDSFLFASDDRAAGVHIIFGGKVIAGTRARKMRSKSYNAFSSINYPHTAVIQDGNIIFYIKPEVITKPPVFYHKMNTSVCVLKLIPGMPPDVLQYISEHYDAVILESFGVGGIPDDESTDYLTILEQMLNKNKVVVMATQVIHEGSDMSVYKVGNLLKKRYQLLESYDMTLESTVTKLMWILGLELETKEIPALFYETINQDILLRDR